MENTNNEKQVEETKIRNYTLDGLKFFFAIMVILVHFPLDGEVGHICSNIGICGVILFFLISGYKSYDEDDNIASKNILRRLKRNGITLLIMLLIYLIFTIIFKILTEDFGSFIDQLANPWTFPRIILFGDLSFINADPLWFMVALIFSYLILYILHKEKSMKYAYYLLPLFIISRIILECYVNTFNTDWHYSSFFLASGFPIMLFGSFIAKNKEKFLKAPLYVTIILTIISTALMLVTIHFRVFGFDIAQIFKIWCMVELFILALKLPGQKETLIAKLGRKYSAYIYLFHFLIGLIIANIFYIDYLVQATIIISSILISILLFETNQILKNKVKSRKA